MTCGLERDEFEVGKTYSPPPRLQAAGANTFSDYFFFAAAFAGFCGAFFAALGAFAAAFVSAFFAMDAPPFE